MSEQLATQPARPRGLVVTGGLIGTAAVAAVLNAVVATAAHALGASHDFQPLQPSAYVPFTVFGVLAAAAAWAIIRARSTRPARVLRVLVPAVVLVSLVPDIMVGATAGQPGTSWGAVVALVVMHLVVAAVAVPAYQRLLLSPPPRTDPASRRSAGRHGRMASGECRTAVDGLFPILRPASGARLLPMTAATEPPPTSPARDITRRCVIVTDDIDRDRPQTEPSPPALNLAPAPHLTPVPDQATPPDQTVPGTVERPAGRAQLTLLVAGICMPVLGSALIAPVLPQMQRHFHSTPGSDVLVPMVVALPGLFLALSAPLLGSVADRTNRKALLLIAMALYAVVGSAPLYLASLVAIDVSRVLLGACEGVILICCTSLIGDYWTGARRAKYLSVSTLATSLAATAFLAVGGVLGVSGWRTPFWMYVLPLLLLVPMARLLWQPPRTSTPGVGTRLEPLPRRQVLVPCLVTLFGGLYFFTLVVELPFILDGIGIHSTAVVGTISAVMALATATGSALFPRLAARPARVLVPLEFAGVAVGLATVFATGALPVVVTGAIITGFSTGVMLPTLLVWAVHRLNYSQRGRGTGWWSGALTLGQFFCPLVVAGLSAASGGLQPALLVLALAAALLAATVLLGLRHQHDPLDPSPGEPVAAPAAP